MRDVLKLSPIYCPDTKAAKSLVEWYGTPVFVMDQEVLENRIKIFKDAFSTIRPRIFYAMKANYNLHLLSTMRKLGIDGVDTVSPFEIKMAKRAGFEGYQILFTGNASSNRELKAVMSEKVTINLGSLSELERFGELFPESKVSLRLNPGVGDGESRGTITGGQDQKFGIMVKDLDKAKSLIQKHKLQMEGIHCHIGSGFYEVEKFRIAVENILKQAAQFEKLRFVDLGGGFGVRYRRDQKPIDLKEFGKAIDEPIQKYIEKNGEYTEIRFEPGKYLVAESTCLLTTVTTRKSTDEKDFVCIDTGFNHLIRPALYGSSHEIVNVSRPDAEPKKVTVVGNVCESTDIFADGIELPDPQEGDVLAIVSAGAYGMAMSSLYNLRPYPTEVVVNNHETRVIRRRPDFDTLLSGLGIMDHESSRINW